MMARVQTWILVLRQILGPGATLTSDDWHAYIEDCLLPEVNAEAFRFYGHMSSWEALFPGHDYAEKRRHTRLQAFPYHNQLFRIFDKLKLRKRDIRALCVWRGTLTYKMLHELRHNTRITDTTFDGIPQYNKPAPRASVLCQDLTLRGGLATPSIADDLGFERGAASEEEKSGLFDKQYKNSEQNREEEVLQSQYSDLDQGLTDESVTAAWGQWMREALERGDAPLLSEDYHLQALQSFAGLSNQPQVHILHRVANTVWFNDQIVTVSSRYPEQTQREPAVNDFSDEASIRQPSRFSSLQPSRSFDELPELLQPAGFVSCDSEQTNYQLLRFSNDSAPLLVPSA